MDDIEWCEPPQRISGWKGQGQVVTFVERLKEHPERWAKYPNTVAAASMSAQNRKRFPGTEWTVRRRPDGRHDLYGRWVGDQ